MADLQSSIVHRRNGKSAAAFRTISEVADDLEVPPHVLRFWETKFNQVRPLKRGGGRRYYRPEDVALLQRIRELLYREGYTIKGVQKLLRDGAVRMPTAGETARAAQSANPVKGGNASVVAPAGPPVEADSPAAEPAEPVAETVNPAGAPVVAGDQKAELRSLLDELKELKRRLSLALS